MAGRGQVDHQHAQLVQLAAVLGMDVGRGGVEGDLYAIGQHVRQQAVDALAVVLRPSSRARARPSEVASMPTIHTGSSTGLRFNCTAGRCRYCPDRSGAFDLVHAFLPLGLIRSWECRPRGGPGSRRGANRRTTALAHAPGTRARGNLNSRRGRHPPRARPACAQIPSCSSDAPDTPMLARPARRLRGSAGHRRRRPAAAAPEKPSFMPSLPAHTSIHLAGREAEAACGVGLVDRDRDRLRERAGHAQERPWQVATRIGNRDVDPNAERLGLPGPRPRPPRQPLPN